MPDLSTVAALARSVAPEPWAALRSNSAKALRYYRGTHKADIRNALSRYFPEAMGREEFVEDVTNFVRKVVDRAANLWSIGVDRTYTRNGDPLAEDSAVYEIMAAQEDRRGIALQSLDRRCYLCRSAVLMVGWAPRREALAYRVISPADLWIAPGDTDPDDVQDARAVIYRLAGTGDTQRFCMWTPEYQLIYQGDSVDQVARIEDDASGQEWRNPLGLLPFVVAREEDPEGLFFPPFAEDLIETATHLNIAEALQTANVWWQSHGQLVVPETTNTKQPWGRGVAWKEPEPAAGQTRYLTRETPFEELTDHIQRKIRTLALSRDLPPNDFTIEGGPAPESGFAKLMDSLPLLDLRQSRIGRVGLPTEKQLVRVESAVLRYGGQSVPDDLGVDVAFCDPSFPRSDEEVAQAHKTTRETQEIEIRLGLTTPARILADEMGISDEEAADMVAENKAQNAEDQADNDATNTAQPA